MVSTTTFDAHRWRLEIDRTKREAAESISVERRTKGRPEKSRDIKSDPIDSERAVYLSLSLLQRVCAGCSIDHCSRGWGAVSTQAQLRQRGSVNRIVHIESFPFASPTSRQFHLLRRIRIRRIGQTLSLYMHKHTHTHTPTRVVE